MNFERREEGGSFLLLWRLCHHSQKRSNFDARTHTFSVVSLAKVRKSRGWFGHPTVSCESTSGFEFHEEVLDHETPVIGKLPVCEMSGRWTRDQKSIWFRARRPASRELCSVEPGPIVIASVRPGY